MTLSWRPGERKVAEWAWAWGRGGRGTDVCIPERQPWLCWKGNWNKGDMQRSRSTSETLCKCFWVRHLFFVFRGPVTLPSRLWQLREHKGTWRLSTMNIWKYQDRRQVCFLSFGAWISQARQSGKTVRSLLRIFYCFCRGTEVQEERKGDHPDLAVKNLVFKRPPMGKYPTRGCEKMEQDIKRDSNVTEMLIEVRRLKRYRHSKPLWTEIGWKNPSPRNRRKIGRWRNKMQRGWQLWIQWWQQQQ